MTDRPIIDAGPALNFFSINKERLLISVVGPLATPETVQREVLRKAKRDQRFAAAERVWMRLGPKWMEILSDDITPEIEAAVQRISSLPMTERLKHLKDLGETMVIAHAAVLAETGQDVTVLIDEGDGTRIATLEAHRLQRLVAQGRPVGSLTLISTLTVLEAAAGGKELPNVAAMRMVYERLRAHDDGLPPIETTRLLLHEVWE